MYTTINNEDFSSHLTQIKQAKEKANQVLETLMPGHNSAEKAIQCAWNIVFDELLKSKKEGMDIEGLNTTSAIIHKLMSAFHQMKKIEIGLREISMREKLFAYKEDQLKTESLSLKAPPSSLSPQDLAAFEKQLHLL